MRKSRFFLAWTLAFAVFWTALAALIWTKAAGEGNVQSANRTHRALTTAERVFPTAKGPLDGLQQLLHLSLGDNEQSFAPFVAALYDKDGRMLVRTENMLTVLTPGSDGESDRLSIPLDTLLTEEQIGQLRAQSKNRSFLSDTYGDMWMPDRVLLRRDGDRLVPVELTLSYGLADPVTFGTTAAPALAGKGATYEAEAYLYLFDVNLASRKMCGRVAWMENALDTIGEAYRNMAARGDAIVPDHVYLGPGSYSLNTLSLSVNGEPCTFVLLSERDTFRDTLSLASSRLIYMTVLSVFFWAVCLTVAWRVRRSRLRLAHSRYAFLSAAAHELKTPLAAIRAAAECVAEEVSPEKNAAYADMILRESDRMGALIAQMLTQNRYVSADGVRRLPTDLAAILETEAEKARPAAEGKGQTLILDVKGPLRVSCDPAMAAAAVQNFLSNAVRYAPDGANITLSLRREGRRAEVRVHNTGSRIVDKDLPHIWEELYRADKARADGAGGGLGLSICREVFRLHRWSYGCENEKKGVSFWFRAPLTSRLGGRVQKDRPKKAPRLLPSERAALGAAAAFVLSCFAAVWVIVRGGTITLSFTLSMSGILLGLLTVLLACFDRRDGKKIRLRFLIPAIAAVALPPLVFLFVYFGMLYS